MKTAILLLTAVTAFAHRLDEYLQATLVSVEENRVRGEMTLTPGVAVYRVVMAAIGSDERAYAERVLQDLAMNIDGRPLKLQLLSSQFSSMEYMKEGRGEIRIEFGADLPSGGESRKIVLENRHLSRIAVYQVNCLVPRDPNIRIVAQKRNYEQSVYQLEYEQGGARSASVERALLGLGALLLFARFGMLWKRRCQVIADAP